MMTGSALVNSGMPLPSLRTVQDNDPYGFYDRVREAGGVVWDEELHAWLVCSFDACKELMRNDKVLVRHPYADLNDDNLREIEGRRSRNWLHGDDHTRYHRWMLLNVFSPKIVDTWRPTLIRPVIDRLIDEFAGNGKAELVGQLADKMSVRIIAAVLGLPWQDEEWIRATKSLLDKRQAYMDASSHVKTHGKKDGSSPMVEEAVAAALALNDVILPFVEAAKKRTSPPSEDVLASLWLAGPSILPDWGVVDMVNFVTGTFFAGTDTTMHASANAFHLIMTTPGLQETLKSGGRPAIERFTEEVLRLYGSVHFRFRLANQDLEIAGTKIKKDELLYVLLQGSNRDPAQHACPAQVDLSREVPRDHLAFSFGPRICTGASLARTEIQEIVDRVVNRLPNLRLDPNAPAPKFGGFMLRSFKPLHALFDTAR